MKSGIKYEIDSECVAMLLLGVDNLLDPAND